MATKTNPELEAFKDFKSSGGGKYLRMSDLKERAGHSATFRFITPPFYGYEKWTNGNRPFRIREGEAFPKRDDWRKAKDEDGNTTVYDEPAKEFGCAGVFDLDDNRVKVWSWTQKKFNKRLMAKLAAKLKGNRSIFDLAITVTRIEMTPVDYEVDVDVADPYTAEQETAIREVKDSWVGPEALLGNGDPFAPFDEAAKPKDADIPF